MELRPSSELAISELAELFTAAKAPPLSTEWKASA
jgi:hypothetical protein